jgi:hypothetical protein
MTSASLRLSANNCALVGKPHRATGASDRLMTGLAAIHNFAIDA